jgi:RNA polymerase sigma-70 factor (ECF subfamily)
MNGSPLTKTAPEAGQSGTGEPPEAEAIRLAQQGDERGFERIYRLHSKRVYALCFRMMRGNAAEAEELTQESFLQLFRKINTFRGESAFSTWLHRLAFNIVLMRLRKRNYQVVSLDEMLEPGEKTAGLEKFIASRDLQLCGTVDRMDIERAIEQLPRGYKTVFVLHDVEGYEHHEIATMRGSSLGNSKSQLHKARARLQRLLRTATRKKEATREDTEPVFDTACAGR